MYDELKSLFPKNGHSSLIAILNTLQSLANGVESALEGDQEKLNRALDIVAQLMQECKK